MLRPKCHSCLHPRWRCARVRWVHARWVFHEPWRDWRITITRCDTPRGAADTGGCRRVVAGSRRGICGCRVVAGGGGRETMWPPTYDQDHMRAGARALRPKPGQTDLDLVFFCQQHLIFYYYIFIGFYMQLVALFKFLFLHGCSNLIFKWKWKKYLNWPGWH
jgi:hypothetical protein